MLGRVGLSNGKMCLWRIWIFSVLVAHWILKSFSASAADHSPENNSTVSVQRLQLQRLQPVWIIRWSGKGVPTRGNGSRSLIFNCCTAVYSQSQYYFIHLQNNLTFAKPFEAHLVQSCAEKIPTDKISKDDFLLFWPVIMIIFVSIYWDFVQGHYSFRCILTMFFAKNSKVKKRKRPFWNIWKHNFTNF